MRQEMMVSCDAVASAGQYAYNLHLAPESRQTNTNISSVITPPRKKLAPKFNFLLTIQHSWSNCVKGRQLNATENSTLEVSQNCTFCTATKYCMKTFHCIMQQKY